MIAWRTVVRAKLVVAVTCMNMAAPAWAGPSLSEAVLRSLARNPEVRAAEAETAMAATEVEIARNAYLPTLNGSAGPAAAGLGYDVTLSQTLYDFGATGGLMEQKRALLAQAQMNLQVVRDDAALEVAEVHLDIASRRAQLSLIDEHIGRLSSLSEMAKTRVEGRYSDAAESGRVALAVATAQGTQARLRGELTDATDHYRLLVDLPSDGLSVPEPPIVLQSLREEGALEAAIAAAPLHQRARLGVRVADAAIREARAQRFPRLALEGSLQRREIGGRLVDDSSIGVRFRFASQQGLSALQRPRLEAQRRQAAEMTAEAVGRDLMRLVESLEAQDQALAGRIDALADLVDSTETVRSIYGEQFLVGRRDIQDLVIMETEHFEAERQIVELTIERLRLQYRAAAQLGRLTALFSGDEMHLPVETLS